MNEHKDFYEKEYMPRQHKIGKFTGYLGTVLCFAPALVLGFLYHCWPNPGLVLTSFITAASSFAFLWFIEPISYYPIVGPVGTYMAFISGNISNMRVPCASMAQIAADVEPGTEKGSIIATIGMGVSVLINVSILTLGVIAGTQILSMLPAAFTEALRYSDPASSEALVTVESNLSDAVDELQQAITSNDSEVIRQCCQKASALLVERNQLCLLNK